MHNMTSRHFAAIAAQSMAFALGCSMPFSALPPVDQNSTVPMAPGMDAGGAADAGQSVSDAGSSTSDAGTAPGPGPNPFFANLVPAAARDLGLYTCDELAGHEGFETERCQRVTDYSGFAYDSKRSALLMFGGGHAATVKTDVQRLDLTAPTLRWTSAYASTPLTQMTLDNLDAARSLWRSSGHPVQRHTYDHLSYVPTTDRLVLLAGPGVVLYTQAYPADFPGETTGSDQFEYDPQTKQWSHFAATEVIDKYGASSFDPKSNRVLFLGRDGLTAYDPVTHSLTRALGPTELPLAYAQNMVYAEKAGAHFYLRSDGRVFRVDYQSQNPTASTVAELTVTGDKPQVAQPVDSFPDSSETGWAYDSKRHRICGALREGFMFCFDPETKAMSKHRVQGETDASPLTSIIFHTLQYDPINDVFVFLTEGKAPYTKRTAAWRPGP